MLSRGVRNAGDVQGPIQALCPNPLSRQHIDNLVHPVDNLHLMDEWIFHLPRQRITMLALTHGRDVLRQARRHAQSAFNNR